MLPPSDELLMGGQCHFSLYFDSKSLVFPLSHLIFRSVVSSIMMKFRQFTMFSNNIVHGFDFEFLLDQTHCWQSEGTYTFMCLSNVPCELEV